MKKKQKISFNIFELKLWLNKHITRFNMFLFENGFSSSYKKIQNNVKTGNKIFEQKVCHEVFISEIKKGKDVIMSNGFPKLRNGRFLA